MLPPKIGNIPSWHPTQHMGWRTMPARLHMSHNCEGCRPHRWPLSGPFQQSSKVEYGRSCQNSSKLRTPPDSIKEKARRIGQRPTTFYTYRISCVLRRDPAKERHLNQELILTCGKASPGELKSQTLPCHDRCPDIPDIMS